jgi:amino acid transporter
MYLALGIAITVYVGISLGVFGTLTVDEVIASGPTAIAVAAEPTLGRAGFWLMSVTALFATSGATNAGLYPAAGLCDELARTGQFPTFMGGKVAGRAPAGLLFASAAILIMVLALDLSSIASVGSAVALTIFALVTCAHLRVYRQTAAQPWILVTGLLLIVVTLVTFTFTTLINEPATIVTLVVTLVVSVGLDLWWSASRPRRSTDALAA